MSARRRHRRATPRKLPSAASSDRLDDILHELEAGRRHEVPDVADAVLARLGYRRVSRREAWMSRLARIGRRTGSVFCVLILLGVGLYAIDATRREQGRAHAIDDLVRASVRERGSWLDDVVQGLRPVSQIPAALLEPSPTSVEDKTPEGSQWTPAVEPVDDSNVPTAVPAVAPFRQA